MGLVIPFFIYHKGCPHRCRFCNQLTIGGRQTESADTLADLRRTIEQWLSRSKKQSSTQVAFFGGSFTCLEESLQLDLLKGVAPYIEKGLVDSIRLSTRPDCLTADICDFLVSHGVRTVEIGAQSLDNRVLEKAERGHNVADIEQGVQVLADHGLEIGIQLMVGLPGETTRSFLNGVKTVISLAPDLVRFYPTLVLENTGLADYYKESSWQPLSLSRAVALTGKGRDLCTENNIRVVRMGLQPSAELEQQLIAGPYHPAFGELVMSRSWYQRIRPLLIRAGVGKTLKLTISDRDCSALMGLKRTNIRRLTNLAFGAKLIVETNNGLPRDKFYYAVG